MIEPTMMRRAFASSEGYEELTREDCSGSTAWATPAHPKKPPKRKRAENKSLWPIDSDGISAYY